MALGQCQDDMEPIIVGDLNVDLGNPEGRERDKYLVAMLEVKGL